MLTLRRDIRTDNNSMQKLKTRHRWLPKEGTTGEEIGSCTQVQIQTRKFQVWKFFPILRILYAVLYGFSTSQQSLWNSQGHSFHTEDFLSLTTPLRHFHSVGSHQQMSLNFNLPRYGFSCPLSLAMKIHHFDHRVSQRRQHCSVPAQHYSKARTPPPTDQGKRT